MTKALSKIREELLYSTVVFEHKERILYQIDEDNRKVAAVWSVVELVFWVFCLALSINDPSFERCRPLYGVTIVLSTITFVLAAFVVPLFPRTMPILTITMQIILLGAGIGLAFFQWDVRSATFIAMVLIVPVMFLTDTLPTIACEILGIALLTALGPQYIVPEVFSWTMKTLAIFSIAGVLIGHVINKARFERYAFEDAALELAELRHKFAYSDQLTGLQNRRAYSEKAAELAGGASSACCVVSVDINGLKQTNDTYGHGAGDELIIGSAECLSACFENVGEVYRLGGDEFCVIAMETEEDVARRLEQLDQMAASWKGQLVSGISLSYGVAAAHGGSDIEAALKEADQRMYEYKREYYSATDKDRRHPRDGLPAVRDA